MAYGGRCLRRAKTALRVPTMLIISKSIVGEVLEEIEKFALLAEGSDEQAMDIVHHEHAWRRSLQNVLS